MKFYKTEEEAMSQTEEGKGLFTASLNGTTLYAWGKLGSAHNQIAAGFLKVLGGYVRMASKARTMSLQEQLALMPKDSALAYLDKLRAEVEKAR